MAMKRSNVIRSYWDCLDYGEKVKCLLMIPVGVVSAFAELVAIGGIIPYTNIMLGRAPESQNYIELMGLYGDDYRFNATVIFLGIIVVASGIRIFAHIFRIYLARDLGVFFSKIIFSIYISDAHFYVAQSDGSRVISHLAVKLNNTISQFFQPVLMVAMNIVLLFVVLAYIVRYVDTEMIVFVALVGAVYFLTVFLSRKMLRAKGRVVNASQNIAVSHIKEAVGSVRDIKLHGAEYESINKYIDNEYMLRNAQAAVTLARVLPKHVIESLIMLLLLLFVYMQTDSSVDQVGGFIATIAVIVFGAQRFLPIAQQIYSSWASISGSYETARELVEVIQAQNTDVIACSNFSVANDDKIQSIKLKNFRPPRDVPARFPQNIKFEVGKITIISGVSGCGKSTLLDVISGLLDHDSGDIYINDKKICCLMHKEWRRRISYMSQDPYMYSGDLKKNLDPFNEREFDLSEVVDILTKLGLDSLCLDDESKSISNIVLDEGGLNISGGQKQRIVFAREYLSESDVILMDEVTSALDAESNKKIMNLLESVKKDKIVILVTHNRKNYSIADEVIEL